MTSVHPHAPLRVIAPSTVPDRIPSYEVQLDLVLSVQPPVEEDVMPAAVRREAAADWESGEPEREVMAVALAVRAQVARVKRVVNWIRR